MAGKHLAGLGQAIKLGLDVNAEEMKIKTRYNPGENTTSSAKKKKPSLGKLTYSNIHLGKCKNGTKQLSKSGGNIGDEDIAIGVGMGNPSYVSG